ncbi:MAG TPA: 3-dehydroquinate dehydratase [Rhodobacteraceae bacterium]|nr:3-dehydroquinate dehydratase [Paracoccaceae bacterium]
MRLGFIAGGRRGEADRVLSAFGQGLAERGASVAGVVQTNVDCGPDRACDMDVTVLPAGPVIRISQSLGPGARGCRLDTAELERAVVAVSESLAARPGLLIVNKFGKHEADGRGFRPLIGEALALGIPVLTAVNAMNRAAFLGFAEELAEELPATEQALDRWYRELAGEGFRRHRNHGKPHAKRSRLRPFEQALSCR